MIAGYYFDSKFTGHGFLRDPNGEITVFDAPGAGGALPNQFQGTIAVSINDCGDITGFFIDRNLSGHGFIRWSDGRFTEFDVDPELGSETAAELVFH